MKASDSQSPPEHPGPEALGLLQGLAGRYAHDLSNLLSGWFNSLSTLGWLLEDGASQEGLHPNLQGLMATLRFCGLRATEMVQEMRRIATRTESFPEPLALQPFLMEFQAVLQAARPLSLDGLEDKPLGGAILVDEAQVQWAMAACVLAILEKLEPSARVQVRAWENRQPGIQLLLPANLSPPTPEEFYSWLRLQSSGTKRVHRGVRLLEALGLLHHNRVVLELSRDAQENLLLGFAFPAAPASEPGRNQVPAELLGRQEMVFLVESEGWNQSWLAALLGSLNFAVRRISSPLELRKLQEKPGPTPAAVLLNLVLAGSMSWEGLQELQEVPGQGPVLVGFSGTRLDRETHGVPGLHLDAPILGTPFSRFQLCLALRTALDNRQALYPG